MPTHWHDIVSFLPLPHDFFGPCCQRSPTLRLILRPIVEPSYARFLSANVVQCHFDDMRCKAKLTEAGYYRSSQIVKPPVLELCVLKFLVEPVLQERKAADWHIPLRGEHELAGARHAPQNCRHLR